MKLYEISSSTFNNWTFPDNQTLKSDFDEYKKKEQYKWKARAERMGFRFPIFDTFETYISTLKSSPIITLSKEHDYQIHNRSHTNSIDELKNLVSSYIMPRDVDRIINGFKTNATIPYPVILKGTNGEWIMSGNTRLDSAFIMGITPKVIIADVNKLNEELYHTYSDRSWRNDIDVYIQPTYKEVMNMSKKSYDCFRTFLLPNGDMYAWGEAIHHVMFKKLKLNIKDVIPLSCYPEGKFVKCLVTDFVANTRWYHDPKLPLFIENHTHFKKLFNEFEIEYYDEGRFGKWELLNAGK